MVTQIEPITFEGRFPGESPRSFDRDQAGLEAYADATLLGAYAAVREFCRKRPPRLRAASGSGPLSAAVALVLVLRMLLIGRPVRALRRP